ncbi:MAG: tetratricopeptide repeat protein [Chloroflexota bacterium]
MTRKLPISLLFLLVFLTGCNEVDLTLLPWDRFIQQADFPDTGSATPVKVDLSDPNALYEQGLAQASQQHWEAAIISFDQAIDLKPGDVDFHYQRGLAYMALENFDQAGLDLTEAHHLDRERMDILFSRGELNQARGKNSRAIAYYNRAIKRGLETPQTYMIRGNLLFLLGNIDKATADYERAFELASDDLPLYRQRAQASLAAGQYERAIQDYTILVDAAYEPLWEAYQNRGRAFARQGSYDQAIADYDQAIALNPDKPLPYFFRGNAYANVQKYEEAVADYNEAIQIDPQETPAFLHRGYIHYVQGQYNWALADYRRAEATHPEDALGHYSTAWVMAFGPEPDYQAALTAALKAVDLAPNADNHHLLGLVYTNLAQPDEALKQFDQALALTPRHFASLRGRGDTYLQVGDVAAALIDYQTYLDQRDFLKQSEKPQGDDFTSIENTIGRQAQSVELTALAKYSVVIQEKLAQLESDLVTDTTGDDVLPIVIVADLPTGFTPLAAAELQRRKSALSDQGYQFDHAYNFSDDELDEIVWGVTGSVDDFYAQFLLDRELEAQDIMLEAMPDIGQSLGFTNIWETNLLADFPAVGNASFAGTLLGINQGIPRHLQLVIFRRETTTVLLYHMYIDGEQPTLSMADLAQRVDARATIFAYHLLDN